MSETTEVQPLRAMAEHHPHSVPDHHVQLRTRAIRYLANPSDEVSMTQEFGYRNRKRPSRARPSTAPHLLTGLGTTELSLRVTTPGMAAASTAPTPAADTGPPSTTPDTPQDRSSHEELLPAEDGTLELPGDFCLEDLLPISLSDDVSRASSSRDGPRQSRSAAKMRVRAGLRCMQCYALKADCSCGKNTVRAAELSLSLLKAPARSVQKTCPFDAKLQAPRLSCRLMLWLSPGHTRCKGR